MRHKKSEWTSYRRKKASIQSTAGVLVASETIAVNSKRTILLGIQGTNSSTPSDANWFDNAIAVDSSNKIALAGSWLQGTHHAILSLLRFLAMP